MVIYHRYKGLAAPKHYRPESVKILEQVVYDAVFPLTSSGELAHDTSQNENGAKQPQIDPIDALRLLKGAGDTPITKVADGARHDQ